MAEDNLRRTSGTTYSALIAPESALTGTTELTEVWMLGTLLHRLLLGGYPYPSGGAGLTPGALVQPQHHDPQIPTALARVLQRALSVDPTTRFQSVEALRVDLLALAIVTEFRAIPTSAAIARWEASVPGGSAVVEVLPTPAATFSARLRVDRGNGMRTCDQRPRRSSEAQAVRDARTLLRAVVEGRAP